MELTLTLIEKSKSDRSAANALFSLTTQRILVPYCFQRGVKDWEDVTQTTLMKAWIGLKSFRGNVQQFVSWVRRICNRVIVDAWRRTDSHDVQALDRPVAVSDEYTELPSILARDEFQILRKYCDGWSVKEIATNHSMPIGSVKSAAYRQRIKLQKVLVS
jgi:RNA polymerase sigma factor (sigma-70 family)